MRTLFRICVTPVKGMALVHPDVVELGPSGIPGNRRFFLIDGSGELFSGWEHGPLVQIRPAYDPIAERLTLSFPDGTTRSGEATDVREAVTTNFYGRGVPGRVIDGPWAAAVSAFVGRPLRLVRTDHEGDGPDVHPLTVVSLESVRDLGERGQHDGELDSRRFRINLELEGCEPYEEDAWENGRVQVGGAILRVQGQIPRCRFTTLSPQTGEKDFDTLRQIAKYRPRIGGKGGLPFGMYAVVEAPGSARVGDFVEPLG